MLAFIVLPLMICGCGSSNSADDPNAPVQLSKKAAAPKPAKPEDQVVGIWQIDVANTVIPGMKDTDKAEEAALRMEIKADGTFATTGVKTPETGKWTLKDHTVTITPDKGNGGPPLTLSDDGKKLSGTQTEGSKTATIVMIKAG